MGKKMKIFRMFLLTLIAITEGAIASSLEKSTERSERVRRVAANRGVEQATLSDAAEPEKGPVWVNTPYNMQASYFLGQCMMCPPGQRGPPGQPGPQGVAGRDGRDGLLIGSTSYGNGGSSTGHTSGNTGGSRNEGGWGGRSGVTYVRWGRRACPDTASIVYEGVVGGAHYTHTGGAANYLCLPRQPEFNGPQAGHQYSTYIYGTEYETGSFPHMPNIQDNDVPCAVCLARNKTDQVMIPARTSCPDGNGWRLEYSGFVMSQHSTHPRTMFICVDGEAEGIERSSGNENGALLYPVEVQCTTGAGIPCPPYVNGFELTCSVCTFG